ncbi:4'-phosphopantetheinyl transferase family protein [Streptomyces sp. MAR4 CNX-425]|uniref:4'-phosphopantetheinyl transferase family protein n=1 Tax=Streptomyces sp. MAR4 CNX-425 TaxID=3406343 RepID=UPI003B510459
MSGADAPARGRAGPAPAPAYLPGACVRLDAAVPVHVGHCARPGPLTVCVVSVALLRRRSPAALGALEAAWLAAPEARQLAALRLPKRRSEWFAGRLAIKHAVRAHLERFAGQAVAGREVRVRAVAAGLRAGKPLVDHPVEVGLSHSGDFAVAVCGPGPVGVDLEQRTDLPPHLARELAREPAPEPAGPAPPSASMPLPLRWTCKEAVLKYFGFGLRVAAAEVELTRWHADGRFSWRAGPELRRLAGPPALRGVHGWARQRDGCALALVWRQ